MKVSTRIAFVAVLLSLAIGDAFVPTGIGVIGEAKAIIGRPLTPMSYAGVARRTAYRTAAFETTAVAATAVAADSMAAAAYATAASVPIGTVVGALPGGCAPSTVNGVQYYGCNGAYYRASFQGNNLVYVVVEQP